MKKYKFCVRMVIGGLLFVTMSLIFATAAFAGSANDYSKPGSTQITELTSADVLSKLIGQELPQAEAAYLELYGELKIDYSSYIPTSVVRIGRDEQTGDFSVKAKSYSYVAENGANVIFSPRSATVGDKTVAFSEIGDNEYLAFFESSYYNENEKARVLYKTEIEISEREINSLINKSYNDAAYWKQLIQTKEAEYNNALFEYERNILLYEEYLIAVAEYEAERLLYEEYRAEKTSYERKLKQYNDYLSELLIYEADLVKYQEYEAALKKYNEDYAAYEEYILAKESYDELLLQYEKYVKDIATVKVQLSVIDGIKNTSTKLKRSIYNTVIVGDTVTQVIENKDAIANQAVGAEVQIVDLAGEATENLRALCIEYLEIKGESEKYAYYVVNYEGFRSNFTNLFISLDKLYENSKVRLVLNERGMQNKFEILLAQLYYITNALNDGPVYNYDKTRVYDDKYVVNELTGITPLKLLENVPYVSDGENAVPLISGYPIQVEKPVLTEVSEPVRPTSVPKPAAPENVDNPGSPPMEVIKPTPPAAVADPGKMPEPYKADMVVLDLISAAENSEIVKRDTVSGSRMIEIAIEAEKQLGAVEFFEVQFLDEDGVPLCDSVLVDKGTYADYSGPIPKKAEDAEATYEFIGWKDSAGNSCDITSVQSNLVLYPVFLKHIKSYKVVWNVDGKLTETLVEYGQMPIAPIDPKKDDIGSFEYVFDGWDKEITKVTGNVTYSAAFRSEPICSSEDGAVAEVTRNDDGFIVDFASRIEGRIDLSKILTRIAKNDTVTINSDDYIITLLPETMEKIIVAEAASICVEVFAKENGHSYAICLSLLDDKGNAIDTEGDNESASINVIAGVKLSYSDDENVSLYFFEGEQRRDVRASYKDGILGATFIVGKSYCATVEYLISVLPSGDVKVEVPAIAKKGETVEVSVSGLPTGAVIDMIYYIGSDGKKKPIENGIFIMNSDTASSGAVIIGVEYHIPTYLITFVADGKTIYTVRLKHGETVVAPKVPAKAPDSQYYYSEGFWSPDIVPATADAVYEAKYAANEHTVDNNKGGTVIFSGIEIGNRVILPSVTVIIMPSYVALGAKILLIAFYVCLVLLPLTVVVIVKKAKRSRM